ncbi:hypothetical protein RB981_002728 [Vibrio cholerae]|nr:hypothetical protein [Vibrio cholerae]
MTKYNPDENGLMNFIKEKTNHLWTESNKPYLLSNVVTDFSDFGNAKDILEGKSIKKWVTENAESLGIKILVHPQKSARIVLVPESSNFCFENSSNSYKELKNTNLSNKEITIMFLEVLSKLPQSDLEEVHIPAKLIAKLMR